MDANPDTVIRKGKDRILPGFETHATDWKEPFYFIQAADTQLGMIDNWGDGSVGEQYPNITWDREIELCTQTVQLLNSMRPKPAFFIVCGDLVDAFPDQWPQIRTAQEKDFFKVFKDLDKDIPLVCVCGNHDVGNRPTKETIQRYRSTWGDDYFSFWISGVLFIVLNSQFYEDCSLTPDMAEEQDKWLDGQLALAKSKAKHTIVFQHIPWFLKDPDEAKEYFNIENGLRKKMLDKFYDAGVRKIFCGHYHRNTGGWYKDLELVVTTAIGCQIGQDPHGFRIVKVSESGIEHKYHGLDTCPTQIDLK
jgi:UDP-2,3-diacylglucosamine pyrophosphatase LpxH